MQAESGTRNKSANLDVEVGCPWYINSAEHNFCFWKFANDLDGSVTSDREICQLLGISQPQLNEIFNSAIDRLRHPKNEEAMQHFVDAVTDRIATQSDDNTVYLPESFRVAIERQEEKAAEPEEEIKPVKRGFGMPLHRDGSKVDLFGLYSQKTRDKIRKKRGKKSKKGNKAK
jgi:hypothetical protein